MKYAVQKFCGCFGESASKGQAEIGVFPLFFSPLCPWQPHIGPLFDKMRNYWDSVYKCRINRSVLSHPLLPFGLSIEMEHLQMMRRWFSSLFFLPVLLGLAACQAEPPQSSGQNAPPVTESLTIPDDPDPALWVVKDEDTTIYLFGTIHILKPGLSWFDEAVKDAFDESEELVVEMVQPDPATMVKIVNDLAIDKTGVSLRDKLSEEDRADYEAAMASLNLPVDRFDPFEPWFASISMSLIPLMESGYTTGSGVEDALTSRAKAQNKRIVGLETPEQQLGFFDKLPEDVQIRFLNFNVDTISEMPDGMENMIAHWSNANIGALAELMNAGLEEKIVYETLLSNRNANWAIWVEERMKEPGTVFMAVGAGHLAGDDSLQEQLKKRNILVERVKY